MQPVIVMIIFFIHGHAVGAQLVGSAPTVQACQLIASQIITEHAGQEPKDAAGNVAKPFPICIDTTPAAVAEKHGPSTTL